MWLSIPETVVVVVVVMVGVLPLVVDFREVMMTSSPELAHCTPPSALDHLVVFISSHLNGLVPHGTHI